MLLLEFAGTTNTGFLSSPLFLSLLLQETKRLDLALAESLADNELKAITIPSAGKDGLQAFCQFFLEVRVFVFTLVAVKIFLSANLGCSSPTH